MTLPLYGDIGETQDSCQVTVKVPASGGRGHGQDRGGKEAVALILRHDSWLYVSLCININAYELVVKAEIG